MKQGSWIQKLHETWEIKIFDGMTPEEISKESYLYSFKNEYNWKPLGNLIKN